ncbi:MAG: hypothetical protein UT34_C0001G0508 [candidate division WS6 bacterium GW2011_GWF2_39_15]|uniref:SGNH hydrolase-type esterase domain-containing protein n=1 Tax=candidate division WS6 bacterium GW2011_GWF2_39_15 TaxID=1619100 RepID=A0A0G0QXU3_9BACT|nr:MAG: hypothetical protein UT34_C0001G0508 [candidate division WS6 bacterium GW2011_GWF2_39_15]
MHNYLTLFKTLKPLTVVCIGDSITSQEWCHPNWYDWLNFTFRQNTEWESGVKRKIINSGHDGADVDDFLNNFDLTIAIYKPDAVIVSLGDNEIEKPEGFEGRTRKLLSRIQSINADIILWSTYEAPNPKYSQALSKVNDTYKRLAQEFNAVYIDMYSEFKKYDLSKLFTFVYPWENRQWGMKPGDIDFLHCNEIGNQIIAEKILKEAFDTDLNFINEWKDFGTMHRQDTTTFKRPISNSLN